MPQPKGFEPFTYCWMIQVRIQFTSASNLQLSNRIFFDEAGYNNWKAWQAAQPLKAPYVYIVNDYNKQKWYNDKLWLQTQMNDWSINGNLVPNLIP